MQRSEHDMTAEDRALAAHHHATVTAGYAAALLDRAGTVVLTPMEASALLFAIRELADRVAATAATWQRQEPLTA